MPHQYTSRDFGKTKNHLEVTVPERLIHPQVTLGNEDKSFSEEREHPVHIVDLPSKTLSMTIGGLLAGQSTSNHRHTYETVIYVTKGFGHTVVEGQRIDWKSGDAIYIPQWAWHQHVNDSNEESAEYIACENAPMLQNLGVAIREEAGDTPT